jgi:hypothetical protein
MATPLAPFTELLFQRLKMLSPSGGARSSFVRPDASMAWVADGAAFAPHSVRLLAASWQTIES